MVRLEFRLKYLTAYSYSISIPQWCDQNAMLGLFHHLPLFYFNSSMVRLELSKFNENCNALTYFNSSMVRLELPTSRIDNSTFADFNSSMVRLECVPETGNESIYSYFNSSMVRLESAVSPKTSHFKFISIPQWCDQNRSILSIFLMYCNISIPQWCDQNSR